jgi:hypothetical protein
MSILLGGAGRQLLDARHKRTGSVDHFRGFVFQFPLNLRRYAMSADDSRFAAPYLYRFANGLDSELSEPIHFLLVMDKRPERPNGVSFGQRFLDHFDGALDAETKPVFFSK